MFNRPARAGLATLPDLFIIRSLLISDDDTYIVYRYNLKIAIAHDMPSVITVLTILYCTLLGHHKK